MPENFTNIDKKFTDRAWNEMSKMLDEEMPTTGPKRNGWRRYLLLLILLLVGIGFAFGWKTAFGEFKEPEKTMKTERPIAQIENTEIKTPPQTPDNQSIENNNLNKKSKVSNISTVTDTFESTSFSENNKISNSINKTQKIASKIILDKTDVSKNINQNTSSENSDKVTDDSNQFITISKAKKSDKFERIIAPNEIQNITLNHLDYNGKIPPAKNIDVRKPKPLRPDFVKIKMGDVFHPIETINGVSLGIAAEYSLKNKPISVETGAFYDFISTDPTAENKQFFARTTADELVLSESNNSGGFGSLPINSNSTIYGINTQEDRIATISELQNQDTSTSYLPLELPMRLHYIRLPLDFNFKLNPKWRIKTGLNLAVLLATPSEYRGGLLKSNTSGGFELFFDQHSAADPFASNGQVPVRTIDLGVSLGVCFLITKNLEVGVNYNFGILDHLKLNNLNSFNRYFQLNFSYNFNLNK